MYSILRLDVYMHMLLKLQEPVLHPDRCVFVLDISDHFFISFFLHQEDPLPPSLVDLVMNSPISSVDDLKRLLDVESVGKADPVLEIQSSVTH